MGHTRRDDCRRPNDRVLLGVPAPTRASNNNLSTADRNDRLGSCVDGSHLARVDLMLVQIGRVRSCVRPVDAAYMAAGRNAIRGSGPNQVRGLVMRPDPNGFSRSSVRPILHYLTITPPNS